MITRRKLLGALAGVPLFGGLLSGVVKGERSGLTEKDTELLGVAKRSMEEGRKVRMMYDLPPRCDDCWPSRVPLKECYAVEKAESTEVILVAGCRSWSDEVGIARLSGQFPDRYWSVVRGYRSVCTRDLYLMRMFCGVKKGTER